MPPAGALPGFRAMGTAYIRFARANPAHYRIMFGQFRDLCDSDAALADDASASFQVLLDALAALERDGAIPAPAIATPWDTSSGRACTASPCCRSTVSWGPTRRRPTH